MDQHQLCASLRKFIWSDAECQALSAFVTRETINVVDSNSFSGGPSGLLLHGVMGGGKTSVLKLLHSLLQKKNIVYMDCSVLSLANRGEVERTLLAASAGEQRVILMDNVDFFPSTSRDSKANGPLTMSSRSFTSAAFVAMDDINTTVIATCTNIQAVDASFLHNYRFGSPIKMGVPSRADRAQIFKDIVSEAHISIDCDVPDLYNAPHGHADEIGANKEQVAVQELALRTQGFTACDIFKLMRDHLHHTRIHQFSCSDNASSTESTKLSLSALLQAISQVVPSAGLQAQNAEVTRFIRQIDTNTPRTVLVGMETVQRHLLKCIATVVPELRETKSDVGSLRKCSGIVLVGPSGSGKTDLTEWLAQATHRHCKFMAVPCADLVHKVVGETERKLAEIFSTARELSPCIVLLDNLDMLLGASSISNSMDAQQAGGNGARRIRSQRTRHQAVDRMLSTLLVEIDGLDSSSSASKLGLHHQPSVIVVATTSRMDCLDRALIRPGRLEEHVALSLPNCAQRRACLLSLFDSETQALLADTDGSSGSNQINVELRNKEIGDIARCTEQKSYAYLRALYQEATIAYARDAVFSKLSAGSMQRNLDTGSAEGAGTGAGKIDFASVLAATGGPSAKLEFVCQYMLKRVKLF